MCSHLSNNLVMTLIFIYYIKPIIETNILRRIIKRPGTLRYVTDLYNYCPGRPKEDSSKVPVECKATEHHCL